MEFIFIIFLLIINILITTIILFIIQKPDTSGQTISTEVEELKEIISVSNQKFSTELKRLIREIEEFKSINDRESLNLKKYIANEIDKLRE